MRKRLVILAMAAAMAGAACSKVTVSPPPPPPPVAMAPPPQPGNCVPIPPQGGGGCIDTGAAGGKCKALLTYDNTGKLVAAEKVDLPGCYDGNLTALTQLKVTGPSGRGEPVQALTGSLTFGTGTTTCYPTSPPWCVCTRAPCP